MFSQSGHMFLRFLVFLLFLLALVVFGPRLFTAIFARSRIYEPQTATYHRVAIVFGAGLQRDGTPAAVLRDRVTIASELYFAGKVDKLLMSGDNRTIYYNEPQAMHDYAVRLGVPSKDIVLDYAGQRTYDTCYRARDIFGLDDAILVTQAFHLPRAIYTCNTLGIQVIGVPADRRNYSRGPYIFWNIRELLATINAVWELHYARPLPILGRFEPIFPPEEETQWTVPRL
jgi:SanA protein